MSDHPVQLETPAGQQELLRCYQETLLSNVVPFWLRHGLDQQYGGYFTVLDRDGTVIDTDKSVWFLGRGAWLFSELYNQVDRNKVWLEAAQLGIDFLQSFGASKSGKLYFTLTQDGQPLRLRRYVYSEAFAAIACSSYGKAINDSNYLELAKKYFETFISYSFDPGVADSKTIISTREMQSLAPRMIGIITAQEIRQNWGEVDIRGQSCSKWIDQWISEIESRFYKPREQCLMETVGADGEILNHADGRLLNPGHAIECAWFIMRESQWRNDRRLLNLGTQILDNMWERGWDKEYGGLFYFRDLRNLPVTEYWHDMKFWWPHCEAIIATLMAWNLTGEQRFAVRHQQVHDWSFRHFADPEYGEWYGYLHRDGSPSNRLKGTLWKGPFHLPRMLLVCMQLLGAK